MSKDFPYGVVAPASKPEIAISVLDEYFEVLDELGLHGYIAFGTCLAFYRDNGVFIEGDNDLDVVAIVPQPKNRDDLIAKLRGRGFVKGFTHPPPSNNTHFHKDKILLDVYMRIGGMHYHPGAMVSVRGHEYPMPDPVEEYLAKCYKDWSTPCDEMGKYYG